MKLNKYSLKNIRRALVFFGCTFVMSSCASIEQTSSYFTPNGNTLDGNNNIVETFPNVDINQIALSSTNNIFKAGDIADVSVYNVEALSNTYVVDLAGKISFPLIGEVHIAGNTTTQVQEILTEKYGAQYLKNPGINVKLESKELGRIVVDGAVNKPGVFEVKDIIRLSEAIALAEGLDNIDTNGSKTFIVRNIEGQRKIKEVDLRSIRKLGAIDPQIIPNDVIFVQDTTGRVLFREFLRTIPLLNTAIIYSQRR